MTDEDIINRIDYIHADGLGRGGFQIHFSPPSYYEKTQYDDGFIFDHLDGKYVNPLGPFKKWVDLSMTVSTFDEWYELSYHGEFWQKCSEMEFELLYLRPFLKLLRAMVKGYVNANEVWKKYEGYSARMSKKEQRHYY